MAGESNKLLTQNAKLLNYIRFFNGIGRSELSRSLQLSMPSIYNAVDALSAENILIKNGSNIELNINYGVLIGISIGTSLTKIVFLNFRFEPFSSDTFNTHKEILCSLIKDIIGNDDLLLKCISEAKKRNYIYFHTPNNFSCIKSILNCIFLYIENCVKNHTLNVLSIGLSCTGIVNDKNQTILDSHNLECLNNVPLDTLVSPECQNFLSENDIPVYLVQNSNASVIAEKIDLYLSNSPFKSKTNIVSLYLGVGIGSGLYLNSLYTGSQGYAGEISHTYCPIVESNGEIKHIQKLIEDNIIDSSCPWGCNDCYDYKIRSFVFEKKANEFCDMSSQEIYDYLSMETNGRKRELLSAYLGNMVNVITNFLNTDLVVFTGKFYKSMGLLMNSIDNILDQNSMRYNRNNCKILVSRYGPLSSAIGAAIYSYHKKYNLELSWNYEVD